MTNHENMSGVYVPVTGIEYPEQPDQPILFPKRLREVVLDEHYPYLDKSFLARLRHIAIYLCRYLTDESLESIGKKFGNRDHTTVMHSVNKIEGEQQDNRLLYDQIVELTERIRARSQLR